MIYICYIIYWDNVATCVLAMGNDNDVLSEVAEGRACVGVPDNSRR